MAWETKGLYSVWARTRASHSAALTSEMDWATVISSRGGEEVQRSEGDDACEFELDDDMRRGLPPGAWTTQSISGSRRCEASAFDR